MVHVLEVKIRVLQNLFFFFLHLKLQRIHVSLFDSGLSFRQQGMQTAHCPPIVVFTTSQP